MQLSSLNKTWILDVDGTIVKHNGYLTDGYDSLLEGVNEFFKKIPNEDKIIFLTARKEKNLDNLKEFLNRNNIRYDYLLPNMPTGERILINDRKPSGLDMAYSFNKNRNEKLNIFYEINKNL